MRPSVLVLVLSLLALPATARAHFTLIAPPPASNSTNGGKGDPPCGPTDMPSNVVTPVMGGSKLMLKVNETVFHPGFYRVALSIKSRTELPPDNVVKDANGMVLLPTNKTAMSATADYETTPVFPVLADNLWPHTTSTAMFSGEVTLPNVNCDKCTLQVIEFMAQHPSNGDKAGFFYHHCADLKITADTSKPIFDPSAGGAGGGSSGGAGNAAGSSGVSGASAGGAGGAATVTAGSGTGGGAGGAPGVGLGGGGSASVPTAGAPSAAAGSTGSSASGASAVAGATGSANSGDSGDSGGCSISARAARSQPLLSLLVGLLVLGRRRARRR
ncbi:MAG TPA: SCE4755 family polysaccharide monooxygenase-like protein [Polyangiaceae bacterium]|nr:SCE4755 family polysaccharide monooxygenase-like protein [Polyangiaceae bacterium]